MRGAPAFFVCTSIFCVHQHFLCAPAFFVCTSTLTCSNFFILQIFRSFDQVEADKSGMFLRIILRCYYNLLYQTISIFFVRTVLAYCSCVLLLSLQHVFVRCIRWPRMDINNKITQQTLFCRQFSCKFCAKHFLTEILHFIKNEHTLSL